MIKGSVMRMKPKNSVMLPQGKAGGGGSGGCSETLAAGWEVRPGGMLVQQRSSDSKHSIPIPTIKVKVKYGSSHHVINISSQASFGDLRKMLAGPTGLHPQDQTLIYKEKERDSKVFLDVCGVKDGSKILLVEDELSRERRIIESRRKAKMETASKDIAAIRLEVDKLAKEVVRIELEINGGKKLVDTALLNLIELLMAQLIKLDAISADGDVKLERKMQVKRVQKYIETLDMLKIRNSALGNDGSKTKIQMQQKQKLFTGEIPTNPLRKQHEQRKQGSFTQRIPGAVMVTTNWETF